MSSVIRGTNGATFYITGVQLEVGSVATPYERQIYSDQLAQCQRYYQRLSVGSGGSNFAFPGFNNSTTNGYHAVTYTTKRVAPTVSLSGVADFAVRIPGGSNVAITAVTFIGNTVDTAWISTTVASGLVSGDGNFLVNLISDPYIDSSAEL